LASGYKIPSASSQGSTIAIASGKEWIVRAVYDGTLNSGQWNLVSVIGDIDMSNVYFGAYGSPANGNWNVASNWYSSLGDSQDSPIHLGRVPNISTDNAVIVNGTVTTPPASGTWDITVEDGVLPMRLLL